MLLAALRDLRQLVDLDAASATGAKRPDGTLSFDRLAGQLDEGARLLDDASIRIEAGTRTLELLADLARSWDQEAAWPGETSAVLRSCAAQLRKAVVSADGRGGAASPVDKLANSARAAGSASGGRR